MIPLSILGAIPRPWMLVSVVALCAAGFGAGWIQGVDHAEDRHAAFVAGVAEAGAKQAAKTGAIIKDQQRLTEETRHGYAQALDALHAYYAGRVRGPSPGGCPVPAADPGAEGTAGRPADPGPRAAESAPETQGDDALRERCAVTTLRFLYLRDLIDRAADLGQ